jgi:cardiolipin synthase
VLEALARHAGAPKVSGNRLDVTHNGVIFDTMERDIRAARSSVHILSFIWRGEDGPSERIGKAVLARAPGVACRIVIDPYGSFKFSDRLEADLRASGCELRRYLLRDDLRLFGRNHRRIQVVDGKVAITGGFGIWKSWEGDGMKPEEWRESNVRVQGPLVAELQRAFEQSWTETGGRPLPPSAYPRLAPVGGVSAAFVASSPRQGPSAAEIMTHLLVGAAERSLWIANSYFIPDQRLQELLISKRQQGVDVRVLVPGPIHDVAVVRAAQRETYERLIPGGVRIFEYQPSMMHAKTMVLDGRYIVIGSTNFDQLSFDRMEEGSVVADAPALARALSKKLERDFRVSKEITPQIWAKRELLPELGREMAGWLSDWL